MQNEYYYLGNHMGMARLHGSSAFICVDTRSWESLNYIQGYPIEPQEVSVMKRFLGPGDVFVDIGSNFGLYSMLASEIIGTQGKVYAFEANPHTYKFLRSSAVANRLVWLKNYKWENKALSEKEGILEFAFSPDHLGGGHIRNEGDSEKTHTIVEVETTTLDNYLDGKEKVDFVKIDVEGHELSVLKGMQEVIERSPSIRIMLEYYTYTSEITEYGRGVVEFIRSIGLGICAVDGDGSLRVVPDNEIPTGNLYLLATRQPEADCRRSKASISIRPKGLSLHAVFANGEHALVGQDGILEYRQEHHSDVSEPALFFGPYINLPAGKYSLIFDADVVGNARVSVTSNAGHNIIATGTLGSSLTPINFTLNERANQFEVVVRRSSELKFFKMKEIILERL